jgi:integrase
LLGRQNLKGAPTLNIDADQYRFERARNEVSAIFRPIDKGGTVRTSRLTDRSVANIVKAYATAAGFDAATFSGHSLRSGFLTSAAANGASIFKMMDVSRHKSVDTLCGYVRDAELFKDHAGIGLL